MEEIWTWKDVSLSSKEIIMPIGTFLGAYAVIDLADMLNPKKKKRYKKKYKIKNDNHRERDRKSH